MGLIKTALYAGAGMYAINKIAHHAENKRNQQGQNHQQPQYNNGYPNQPYQGQFQPQQSSRGVDEYQDFDSKLPPYQQRQQGFIEGEASHSGDFASQAMNFLGNLDSNKKSKSPLSGLLSK